MRRPSLSARLDPGPLPWRRPAHELTLLVLVAVAALSVVQLVEAEDITRVCLARAMIGGHVSSQDCFRSSGEAIVHGRRYANVAPGVSALAVPAVALLAPVSPSSWRTKAGVKLWLVRLSTVGLAFLVTLFLVGRVGEGIAPGWGGAALVTFGLGTIASAVAPSSFDHLPAAALAFGAFLLAWSRRPLLAGLLAGLALPVEYQASLILLLIGGYVLLSGRWALGVYAVGTLPGTALIAAYDWVSFGGPLRTSYQFDPTQSKQGVFGVSLPSLHGLELVLTGNRGLIVCSPVLLAAAAGLVLLGRGPFRSEAIVCGAITAAFVLLDAGYFLPYGGASPGPRFVVAALPFLVVGLAPALARFRRATAVLAAASVVACTAIALTWPSIDSATGYTGTIWRYIPHIVNGARVSLARWAQPSIFGEIGVGTLGGAAIVVACGAAALALALWDGWKVPRAR